MIGIEGRKTEKDREFVVTLVRSAAARMQTYILGT